MIYPKNIGKENFYNQAIVACYFANRQYTFSVYAEYAEYHSQFASDYLINNILKFQFYNNQKRVMYRINVFTTGC